LSIADVCNRYRGRDPATGFPLLEKAPLGPLCWYLRRRDSAMYPPNPSGSSSIAPEHLHLVYRWALQILTALSTIHSKEMIHMDVQSTESCRLREDLSLALVGFVGSSFWNLRGERFLDSSSNWETRLETSNSWEHKVPDDKHDLYDWASIVYRLMTDHCTSDDMFKTKDFPKLEDEKLGGFVRRCWEGEYEKASDLSRDVVAYLREQGVDVEGDDIRGFEYQEFL